MISQAELKSLLNYNPDTGIFTRLISGGGIKAGSVVGSHDAYGYIVIGIKGSRYKAHRLAWLYAHGSFPTEQIDHINTVKDDNRLSNLRQATPSENFYNKTLQSNSTSQLKGVNWHKGHKKWVARCSVNGNRSNLGYFDSSEQASLVYQAFAKEHHGEFFNNGESS